MSGRGRPLRFFGMLLVGWTGLRVVLLWPHIDSAPALIDAVVPGAMAHAPSEPRASPMAARKATPTPAGRSSALAMAAVSVLRQPPRAMDRERVALALAAFATMGDPQDDSTAPGAQPGVPRPLPAAAPMRRSRWSGSTWLLVRGEGGIAPGLVGGQLGGSQAGIRIAYALDARRHLAIAGRVATPLGPGLQEAALGLEWQPWRAPVRLVAEYRLPLNGGRGGPAVGAVGGFGPVRRGRFTADGYGQAGVIDRGVREAFADGAAHVRHDLGGLGDVTFDLGAGAWGGAQRGASRLDVGPTLGAVVPLGKQRVRVSLDWRERVAGDARPGSGVALTVGADF